MNRWSDKFGPKQQRFLVMTLLFGEKINVLHGSRGVITEIGIPSMAGKLTTSLQYQAVAVMPLAIYVRYTGKTISELLMEGCLALLSPVEIQILVYRKRFRPLYGGGNTLSSPSYKKEKSNSFLFKKLTAGQKRKMYFR